MTQADSGSHALGTPPPSTPAGRRPSSALGSLPLRLFLGVTYIYAGVDKLANPHFLASGDAFSVAAQMAGYARTSPLAPLINASMPLAVPIGFLIALAEMAVGLGLLTGLAFRLAAAAGAGLSLLFWLTASWSVTPYFFSPDLPYAVGFLTLALMGRAARPMWRRQWSVAPGGRAAGTEAGEAAGSSLLDRRSVLQVGLLGVLTLLAAVAAAPLRLLGYGERGAAQTAAVTPAKTATPATPAPTATAAAPSASPATAAPIASASASASAAATPTPTAAPASPTAVAPSATPAASGAATGGGPVVANVADFASGNSLPFTVPNQVPFAMGPGGPGILVKLGNGSVVGFSAVCTHGRCTVGFDQAAMLIACPCHLATYDPASSAAVLSGPAPLPLPEIPLAVDGSGQVHVTATA